MQQVNWALTLHQQPTVMFLSPIEMQLWVILFLEMQLVLVNPILQVQWLTVRSHTLNHLRGFLGRYSYHRDQKEQNLVVSDQVIHMD